MDEQDTNCVDSLPTQTSHKMPSSESHTLDDPHNVPETDLDQHSPNLTWPRISKETEDNSDTDCVMSSTSDPMAFPDPDASSSRNSLGANIDTLISAIREPGEPRTTLCSITCPICGPNAFSKSDQTSAFLDFKTKIRVERWLESIPSVLDGLQRQGVSGDGGSGPLLEMNDEDKHISGGDIGGLYVDQPIDGYAGVRNLGVDKDCFPALRLETAVSEDGVTCGEEMVALCRDVIVEENWMREVGNDLTGIDQWCV